MRDKLEWLILLGLGVVIAVMVVADQVPPNVVRNALITIAISAIVIAILFLVFVFTYGRHRRNVVKPLHHALAHVLNLPPKTSLSYIHVPRSKTASEAARIYLPKHFTSNGERARIVADVIKAKLHLSEVDFQWHDYGRKPYVSVTRAPQPPAMVPLKDARTLIDRAKESAPLIGVGARQRSIAVDLDAESPHILVSAGTGGGKTTIIRAIAAQVAANGGDVYIFDVKRSSHRWAVDLPNIYYFRDIGDIHNGLIELRQEKDQRNRIAESSQDETPNVGQRILIIVEEGNTMISQLKEYWKENKERGQSDASPAVIALREILLMGRSVKMNVLGVFQLATAMALGGPEMREQFFTRILARYSEKAWRMLTDLPFRSASKYPGRVQVILGGNAYETQVLYLTESEARELAVSAKTLRVAETPRTSETAKTLPEQPATPEPVTLSAAIETGLVDMSIYALRKAADPTRNNQFPSAVGKRGTANLYNPVQLQEWYQQRIKVNDVAS